MLTTIKLFASQRHDPDQNPIYYSPLENPGLDPLHCKFLKSLKRLEYLTERVGFRETVLQIHDILVLIRIRFRFHLEATFTSFLKIKSHKEVTKQEELRFFLLFLLDYRRIRIRIRTSCLWIHIRIQEAQKHTDPDPAPHHCRESYRHKPRPP